jgi:hypothetical protein
MKRLITAFTALLAIAIFSAGALSAREDVSRRDFTVPTSAQIREDGGYLLKRAIDPATGKEVEGVAYLHPKYEAARYSRSLSKTKSSNCYAVMSAGMKWKTVEPWQLDPANSIGIDADFLLTNTSANLAKWEAAAGAVEIFGNGSIANNLSADDIAPDGRNEVLWGEIDQPGTIAVTIVWGYFSGPASKREIVEWDQIYDQTDFKWSISGESDAMDYENVSTHEVGHAAGMGHPSLACSNETMHRYAGEGEINKRSLETGDITGINTLY